ncbi:MAG TPA: c-type cytochrome [Edaphobacter sp.]|nr:c-type cytochrome [Edaphobacter sp.]
MPRIISWPALALVCVYLLGGRASAQVPDTFTNLQSLPKTISRQDLTNIMRGYAFSLGTRCEHCHAASKTPGKLDFASDEKPAKATARTMIRMTEEINHKYVAALSPPSAVECVTCHRGSTDPKTLQGLLSDTIEKNGLASAVTQYRDLRKENYGNGRYDFSETAINILSESLLKQGKAKEAAGMMELNAEANNPLSRWGYGVLAMSHQANKETEKAELDFEKILALDPKDEWARGQLKSLRAAHTQP